MFGYVRICKDELKIKDYNIFRAYYCGLCRSIGKRNQTARLALSYDMTFLAVLLSAVNDDKITFRQKRCFAYPFKKRPSVIDDVAVEYSADMSILLDYLKLKDDVDDDKSIKAFIGMLFFSMSVKKLKRKYPRQSDAIISQLNRLSQLEKQRSDSIDETADCFAKILSVLFTPDFISDTTTRRTLEWLGYNIGRWIYIIDAAADFEKDLKTNSYNPFGKENIDKENLEITLTYTLANAASSYELLDIKKNDDILRNIIYIGLKNMQDHILTGKENTNESL